MGGISAVIPAAGRGERLGHKDPKAFVSLAGCPLLAWSLAALESCALIDRVVVVTQPEDIDRTWRLAVPHGFRKLANVVAGGPDRQSSVLNGMAVVMDDSDVILVHDAARPLTPMDAMERCARAAAEHGSATTSLPVVDTLRHGAVGGPAGVSVDRSSMVRIQTPQAVRADLLRPAMIECRRAASRCTDDSSMVEVATGVKAYLVEGSELSIKITSPGDLRIAEALVEAGAGVRPSGMPLRSAVGVGGDPALRIGFGYDVHSFDASRPMMLGGLHIPDSPGLAGHSDADAALHAICDAILGALGQRDIGYHFPNTDPAFAGADSGVLTQHVIELAGAQGWRPLQVDLTVIAEKPRLGPHVERMRERLVSLLSLAPDRVAVKATTNEKMGFIGRGEGVACCAVAMLRPIA